MHCHECKNLLNYTQICTNIGHFSWISYRVSHIQRGPYSTSVCCFSLYVRCRVQGDFIHLVGVYICSECTACSIKIILILQTDQPKEITEETRVLEGIEKVLESDRKDNQLIKKLHSAWVYEPLLQILFRRTSSSVMFLCVYTMSYSIRWVQFCN